MKFFDYPLDKNLIANSPVNPRDYSRLLKIDRRGGELEDRRFFNIVDYLRAGDVLVLNNSKVFPARLLFEMNGKESELLFLEQMSGKTWKVIGRPGRLLKIGNKFELEGGLEIEILEVLEGGLRKIAVNYDFNQLQEYLNKKGKLPIPPYIKGEQFKFEQYQTVFSEKVGSVAAPTAGLHFTKRLLSQLRSKGVIIEYVTLHVGLGTFLPVKVLDFKDHQMHSENYELDFFTAQRLNSYKKNGQRIIAVGSTATRVLEDSWNAKVGFLQGKRSTKIYIYPGYEWKAVDGLITNFHLPKSTLLLLVASFLGEKNLEKVYLHAIKSRYRFFSFGDATLII